MNKLKMSPVAVALGLAALSLVACGGGGGDSPAAAITVVAPPPFPTAEGVYGGKLTGSSSPDFQLLVLESGEFYTLYGTNSATSYAVSGFIQGTGISNNGKFNSSNAIDFGTSPITPLTIDATYVPVTNTISGTAATPRGMVGFSGGPVPNSQYVYSSAAQLSAVTGNWSTTSIDGTRVPLNIASDGTFTASSQGCAFNGAFVPRPSGKNVFNVTFRFGAAPCRLAGQTGSGIALAYPIAGGRTQLLIAATNSSRSDGTAVFGTR